MDLKFSIPQELERSAPGTSGRCLQHGEVHAPPGCGSRTAQRRLSGPQSLILRGTATCQVALWTQAGPLGVCWIPVRGDPCLLIP